MCQSKRLCILLLLACLVPASVQAITLYRSSVVVMRTLPADSSSANSHPSDKVSPEMLARMLARLQVASEKEGKSDYLLSERDARDIGAELANALGRVDGSQDIHLAIFRDLGGFGSPRRHGTGIRLFVQGGRLHLILGQIDVFLNEFREPYAKLPQPGERTTSVMQGGKMLAQPWFQPVNGREDWLSYPLEGSARERPSLRLEHPGPVSESDPVAADDPTGGPVADSVADTLPGAAAPLHQRRWQALEEGLEALERLRDKGLISEQEYQSSRTKLMREAGL